MIIPSKEERMDSNILVQGARVIRVLKRGSVDVDELRRQYPTTRNPYTPTLERMFDILTYLYIADFVFIDGNYVALKGPNSEL